MAAKKAKADVTPQNVMNNLFEGLKGFEGIKMPELKMFGDDINAIFGDAQKLSTENFVALSNATLDMVQANVNEGFDAVRAVIDAKDVKEATDVQVAYVKSVFARTNTESKKLMEMATEAAKEAAQPMNDMVSKVRDQLKVA